MHYGGNTCRSHPLPYRRWIMWSIRIVLLYHNMRDVSSTIRRDRVTHHMEDEVMKRATLSAERGWRRAHARISGERICRSSATAPHALCAY